MSSKNTPTSVTQDTNSFLVRPTVPTEAGSRQARLAHLMARAGRVVSIKRVKLVVDRFHLSNHIGILSVTLSYGEDFLLDFKYICYIRRRDD